MAKQSLHLSQQQKQQQKLSPQQIQYIKLLQLPTLALEQRIKAELEQNPLLEEGEELMEFENTADDEHTADETKEESNEDEEIDWEEYLNNADDLYGYKAKVDYFEDERGQMPTPYEASLYEYLLEQVGLQNFDNVQELIAEQIIGSIDEDGYLRRSLDAIADDIIFNTGHPVYTRDVEKVLKVIQHFDPVGIATRDLRECLLVQLETQSPDEPGRNVAIRMLKETYKAFTMKHFTTIMNRLEIDEIALKEAFDLIKRLNPKPGDGDFNTAENYIVPDFIVQFVDDDFIISLNSKNAPSLHISRSYREMWRSLNRNASESGKLPKDHPERETRIFLKNKIESARWFINSINQRRNTMLKVMHAIVEVQHEFFMFGEGNLKPMILKDIADRIQMDISTVSRVVSSKYVQTEFGVYSLKYFFSEGLVMEDGEEVSNKEIKAFIQEIIQAENKAKPYSDQVIAKKLEEKGYNIARRTVTKYREQLNIPVARLRKQIILSKV